MIILHTGKLGVGKSYSATAEVWKLIHNGKDCYVNWKIDFTKYFLKKRRGIWYRIWNPVRIIGKVYYWETLDDLYKIRNGELFFDEAHMSIDARDFSKLPKHFKTKLTQSRKYGLNLHFISQHSQQIDIAVRRLANSIIVHTRFWKFMWWREYDGEVIENLANPLLPKPKSIGFGFYLFSKGLARSYDTMALFKPFEPFSSQPIWDAQKIVADQKEASNKLRLSLNNQQMKGGDLNDSEVNFNQSEGRNDRTNEVQSFELFRPSDRKNSRELDSISTLPRTRRFD